MSFKQRSLAKSRTWRLINQSVRLVTLTQVFTRITTIITIKSLVWKFQKTQGKTRTLNHWCCSWLRFYLTVSHQSVKTCRNGKCYVWRPNTIKYSLVTKQHLLLSCLIKIWTSTIIWSSTIKFARLDDDKTRLIAFCHLILFNINIFGHQAMFVLVWSPMRASLMNIMLCYTDSILCDVFCSASWSWPQNKVEAYS